MRMTREELEELNADPEWWGRALDDVRECGGPRELVEGNGWSYGAFIGWVRGDEERSGQYDGALRDYGHRAVMETIPIADGATLEGVGVARERIKARQWVAGKWDRGRYGEKVDHIGVVLDPLSEMLRGISERRLAAMKGEMVVIDVTPEVVVEPEPTEI